MSFSLNVKKDHPHCFSLEKFIEGVNIFFVGRHLFLKAILSIVFFLAVQDLSAQTWNWKGAVSNDWNTAENWDRQIVPTDNSMVVVGFISSGVYPVITSDCSVSNITISDWSGGQLTVTNGATMTVNKNLTIQSYGKLLLDNGTLQYEGKGNNGQEITMAYDSTSIYISNSGAFNSPEGKLTINGELTLESGDINLGNGFQLSSGKYFNVTEGNVNIYGETDIYGILNGGVGNFAFDGDTLDSDHTVTISGGGKFFMSPYSSDDQLVSCSADTTDLSGGTVDFYTSCYIQNSGEFYGGDAYVTFYQSVSPTGNAIIEIHNGVLIFEGDLTLSGTAYLYLTCSGIIRIKGNTTLKSAGYIDAESGYIYLEGNLTSESSSGTINAGSSTIVFSGDTFVNEGIFNAETSTFIFDGGGTEILSTYSWRTNITFYNLIVENESDVQTNTNILVLNDMEVDDSSSFAIDSGKTLDVVGEITGDALVSTNRPYVIVININSTNSITAVFDEELKPDPAQTASNYRVEDEDGNIIDYPTAPTLGGNDNNEVTLTLGFTIEEDVNYYLIVNNVVDLDNNSVNTDHKKRFIQSVPANLWQWIGVVSDDWDTEGNWSKDLLPETDAVVVIPVTPNDPVIYSTGNEISELEIEEDASLTIYSTGNLTVNDTIINHEGSSGLIIASTSEGTGSLIQNEDDVPASFQRYISGETEVWQMLSSPVEGQEISGNFTPTGGSDAYGDSTRYDLYAWYEPDTSWVYLLNESQEPTWTTANGGDSFVPGKGYLVSYKDSHPTKVFQGNLNNGTVSVSLTKTDDTATEFGYNFVGNPYSSSVDWKASSGWERNALDENGDGYDIWIWSETNLNYGVYNSASESDEGTLGVSRYIAPTQGFFVKASQAGVLSMDNSVRVHDGAGNWLKSARENTSVLATLDVESADGYGKDEVIIEFGHTDTESGTPKKFSLVNTSPSLFIPEDDNYYSIRLLGEKEDSPVLPLSFKAGSAGNYELTASFDSDDFEIFQLTDRGTGETFDFKEGDTYSFQATGTEKTARFYIQIVSGNYADPQEALPVLIYAASGMLYVDLRLVEGEYNCDIFSITGRKLMTANLVGGQISQLTLPLAKGIAIVQVAGPEGRKVEKVPVF